MKRKSLKNFKIMPVRCDYLGFCVNFPDIPPNDFEFCRKLYKFMNHSTVVRDNSKTSGNSYVLVGFNNSLTLAYGKASGHKRGSEVRIQFSGGFFYGDLQEKYKKAFKFIRNMVTQFPSCFWSNIRLTKIDLAIDIFDAKIEELFPLLGKEKNWIFESRGRSVKHTLYGDSEGGYSMRIDPDQYMIRFYYKLKELIEKSSKKKHKKDYCDDYFHRYKDAKEVLRIELVLKKPESLKMASELLMVQEKSIEESMPLILSHFIKTKNFKNTKTGETNKQIKQLFNGDGYKSVEQVKLERNLKPSFDDVFYQDNKDIDRLVGWLSSGLISIKETEIENILEIQNKLVDKINSRIRTHGVKQLEDFVKNKLKQMIPYGKKEKVELEKIVREAIDKFEKMIIDKDEFTIESHNFYKERYKELMEKVNEKTSFSYYSKYCLEVTRKDGEDSVTVVEPPKELAPHIKALDGSVDCAIEAEERLRDYIDSYYFDPEEEADIDSIYSQMKKECDELKDKVREAKIDLYKAIKKYEEGSSLDLRNIPLL